VVTQSLAALRWKAIGRLGTRVGGTRSLDHSVRGHLVAASFLIIKE
jgi:hypothetical protein